jgi:hypothetical protein
VSATLGCYSPTQGSAQRLDNGNYFFDCGQTGPKSRLHAEETEVRPNGARVYQLEAGAPTYRAFRLTSLYSGT